MRVLTLLLICLSSLGAPATAAIPARIVSTAPSLTEALFALGLGPSVVGVTDYCLFPPEAAAKPKIGTFLQPSLERILALKPDLVLTLRNPVQLTEKLRRLGLRTEEFNEDTTADVFSALHKLGNLTSRQAEAIKITASISRDFDFVRATAAALPKRRVLFLVGRSPGTFQGMYGAGAGTFIDELMSMAGGLNVLASLGQQYPKVSVEQILSFDPDVILDMGNLDHAAGRPLQPESEVVKLWAQYPQLRAVRGKRVRIVAGEIYIRPGPRMGQAARAFLRLIQGIQ
ncbi:MAG: ABC transporter substrate-binding protein [Bryobacteraceae bacterium]|nr:ABC transporter substrate-binding protein [Bryobacteraceae bacterium]